MSILKKEKLNINHLTFHLKKQQQQKSKLSQSKQKEIKIMIEMNNIENRKIHKTESWFFKKINKIDKSSTILTKENKREDSNY